MLQAPKRRGTLVEQVWAMLLLCVLLRGRFAWPMGLFSGVTFRFACEDSRGRTRVEKTAYDGVGFHVFQASLCLLCGELT